MLRTRITTLPFFLLALSPFGSQRCSSHRSSSVFIIHYATVHTIYCFIDPTVVKYTELSIVNEKNRKPVKY